MNKIKGEKKSDLLTEMENAFNKNQLQLRTKIFRKSQNKREFLYPVIDVQKTSPINLNKKFSRKLSIFLLKTVVETVARAVRHDKEKKGLPWWYSG